MKKFLGGISFYVVLTLSLLAIIAISYMPTENNKKVYSDLIEQIQAHNVARLDFTETDVSATLNDGTKLSKVALFNLEVFYKDASSLSDQIRDKKIQVEYHVPMSPPWWVAMLSPLILILLFGVFWLFILPNAQGGGRNAMSFGKTKARVNMDDQKRVTFEDVAGADEEKEELKEIVDFLKDPAEFVAIGARIPKGVLLVGPPGTGKTLLAKAVAGEANVPFFSISGSDFVEMFVGVGASRVRDLFEQARKNQPCIIFIDEIDAVGRHRGAGMGGGHDEREQTLNQLLVEMDGFGPHEGVIIIAATNRPDILDPALLRPGRFDRQVEVGYPDIKGREGILKVHARGKPLADDVDLSVVAKTTVGFTGADLENLLNEAALFTARLKQKKITMDIIAQSMLKVSMGPEKRSRVVLERDRRLTAYHEAGHAIVCRLLPTQNPVHHVTIIPRGRAGGFMFNPPLEDKSYSTKSQMTDKITVSLGGRLAEKIVLNDISTGASGDIQSATKIARGMVTKFGMSDLIGPVAYGSDNDEVFIGRDFSHTRDYSEHVAAEIDDEIRRIIDSCYKHCEDLLTENIDKLHAVANALLEREKLDGEEFEAVFNGEKLTDSKKEELVNTENQ
ncbi:MAG: ATP-dependent metallopeptidase FtsH/Yme1/Tma family protein [Hyphomonadaceae bacterium]|nr:ATP-dependent metallopeptidase FtsH/Yme1/Tma family protein [Clostridia bacterium]